MRWWELALYAGLTLGLGAFFAWLTRRVVDVSASMVKLRQHEHAQNNALHQLSLSSEQCCEDLRVIRDKLGIPR